MRLKFLPPGLLFLATSGFAACCPPENVSVVAANIDGECIVDIDYEGTALGVYVTEPAAKLPRSNSKFEGLVFFGLDTTTFPDGILPPVRYGDESKDRAVPTKNGYQNSRDYPVASDEDPDATPYGQYPMPLVNADDDCVNCQLSNDPGRPLKSVGPFKVGIVSVPGNTETEPITNFACPQPGDSPVQYGVELPVHRGVD